MATITSPTSFILTNQGDKVKTSEFLSTSQGLYLQFSIPTISYGDEFEIGLIGPNGDTNLYNKLNFLANSDAYGHSILTPQNGLQGIGSNTYTNASIWSMYISNYVVKIYKDGASVGFLNVGGYLTDISLQFYSTYTQNTTNTTYTVTYVLYYPTGAAGFDGASMLSIGSAGPNIAVLNSSSFRFIQTGVDSQILSSQVYNLPFLPLQLEFTIYTSAFSGSNEISIGYKGNDYTISFYFSNGNVSILDSVTGIIFTTSAISPEFNTFAIINDTSTLSFFNLTTGDYYISIPTPSFAMQFWAHGYAPLGTLPLNTYDITDITIYTAGKIGHTGNTGPTGAPGYVGQDGSTGPTGTAGAQGATGWTGPSGVQGTTGPTGIQGATGWTGPSGPVGQGYATLVPTGSYVLGSGEIGYMTMGLYNVLPTTQLGNIARVDAVYGNDSNAFIGGLPFATIQGAINAINSASASGITIWVLPGTYNIATSGVNSTFTDNLGATWYPAIVLPANTCLRGLNIQNSTIQCASPTQNTILIQMNSGCRVEDFTFVLGSASYSGTYNLCGMYFGASTTIQAKLRTSVLTVNNSAVSSSATTNVYGCMFDGTGSLGPLTFSYNCIKGSTVNVYSNGAGNKRGLLVSNTNIATTRDLNVYVAQPTSTSSTGSYVGIETADASNTGSIQIRSTTVGTVTPTVGQSYTASDILQTNPATITNPTYLASAGIQIGPGTDLVTKTAGGKGFSTYIYPTTIYYGLKGDIKSGQSGAYLWPGTQAVSAGVFPDPGTPAAYYRTQQPFILSGFNAHLNGAPGTGNTTTIKIRRTPAGGSIADVTAFTLTFGATDTDVSFYNGSQTFGAGDLIHLYLTYTGNNANTSHDLTLQVDCF